MTPEEISGYGQKVLTATPMGGADKANIRGLIAAMPLMPKEKADD